MTRIGIDCRFAATHTGLGRYTRELVTQLLLRDTPGVTYVLFLADDAAWVPSSSVARIERVNAAIPHYSLAEQTKLPGLIRNAQLDLLFVPHFNAPFFCPVPTVVTVHDLILHRHPNQASVLKQIAYRLLMRRAVAHAKTIIAVSRFTAGELASEYGKKIAGKTIVIHEGVSSLFHPVSPGDAAGTLSRHGIGQRPYFLYVGNAKEHKNVQILIDAFVQSGRNDAELLLVSSGKETEALSLSHGVRLLRGVSDADLPALYSHALAFVTASIYEGFGLPLLEAAACGCPVIATNCASLPEVAPPGSAIVDPTVAAIAAALRAPPARISQASPLPTWDTCAVQTIDVLTKASRQ